MTKYLPLSLAIVFAMAGTALAQQQQTIYLKGSGSNFNKAGWQNVFYLGDAAEAEDPSVWHLVYTGNNVGAIQSMQLEFTNGEVFEWEPAMGFSRNAGGNNPGWVVVAPYDWELAYVNKGNNNASGCFVVTAEFTNNPQFNISGYHKGTADPVINGSLKVKARSILKTEIEKWNELWQGSKTPYKYVSQSYGSVTATNADYKDSLTFDKKNNPQGINVVPNSNHFTYAKLDAAALVEGVELAMVVGNKVDQVGTASVKAVGGKLEISIDDVYASKCGAVAYATLPEPKNGNIHSQKDFAHNNVLSIPLPASQTVYLYMHCDVQFDLTDKADPRYADGYIWVATDPVKVGEEFVGTKIKTTRLDLDVEVTVLKNGELVESFVLNNSSKVLANLPAGEYTVHALWVYEGGISEHEGTVTVVADEAALFRIPRIVYEGETQVRTTRVDLPDIINPVVIVKK